MKFLLTTIRALLMIAVCASFVQAQGDQCEAWKKANFSLFEPDFKPVTQAFIDRVGKVRPCIKTYPWPDKYGHPTDAGFEITSGKMMEIMKLVMGDQSWKSLGLDVDLVYLYGWQLYLGALLTEGEFASAYKTATNLINKHNLKVSYKELDAMEEVSYFSMETLSNIIVAARYIADGAMDPEDLATARQSLDNFLKEKRNLNYALLRLGGHDPTDNLLINAQCY